MSGLAMAAAAQSLVGVPYRRDGRDPQTGLDCLGVVAAALALTGCDATLPPRSTLRRRDDPDAQAIARATGLLRVDDGRIAPGDVLLLRCSPLQLHALVAVAATRFVHAHAGLRRVVEGPHDPAWLPVGHWRLPPAP